MSKIENVEPASTKLRLYKKFYSKDSARFTEKHQVALNRQSDSLFLVTKILSAASSNKFVGKATNDYAKMTKRDYNALIDQYGPAQAKEIKEDYSRYSADLKKYKQQFGKLPSLDSLRNFTLKDATTLAETGIKRKLSPLINRGDLNKYRKELDAVKEQQAQYTDQIKQMGDSAYLKQQAKDKAEQVAREYLQSNPAITKAAQVKMNALMKVYSSVPNSNDLSTAVKRTSLKGRTFRERLVVGGNIQLVSIKPVVIDFFPMIGYKFNTRWQAGVGGTYRWSNVDSVAGLSARSYGYKAFGSFDVVGNIFAYTEFNRNTTGRSVDETGSHITWQNSWLIGAGKKISVSHKLDMTLVVLYNFFHQPGDPLYPKPLTVRVGFQSKGRGLFKK